MKITQAKDYKKPLYAIGLSAAILAVAVTGCTDPGKDSGGGRTKGDSEFKYEAPETTEPQLAGEVVLAGETTVDYDGEIALEGAAQLPDKVESGG